MLNLVVINESGAELGRYPIDSTKSISSEIIRILEEESVMIYPGDILKIEVGEVYIG